MPGPRSAVLRVAPAVLVTVLAALGLLVLTALPARAHAALQTSTPADGEALGEAPAEVALGFSEPVEAGLGALRVFDAEGERVDAGDAALSDDEERLSVGLPEEVGEGTYVVTYAVVSLDAHPVRGALLFTVGDPAATDESAITAIFAQASDGSVGLGVAASVLRALVYGGTLLAAGGVVFLLWVVDRGTGDHRGLGRLVLAGAGVAGVASLLAVGVQGALVTGLGLGAALDPAVLGEVAASSYGLSTGVRLAGLVAVALGVVRLWNRSAVIGSGVGALVTLASFSLTGHTASTDPRWLVAVADLSHTAAAAAWGGGLVLLLVALRRRRSAEDPVGGSRLVARFSTLATGAIVLVSVAGLALAWAQVRAPRALTGSTYGWTLVAKVVVVAAVLGVGAYNQRRLVPAITRGAGDAWAQLRRTVRYEVLGLTVVVLVTAVLVNLVPARTAAGVTGPFSAYVAMGEDYQLNLTVDPNRAGPNEMHLYLLGEDGRLVQGAEDLTVEFTLPANDIAPLEREPESTGPGHWTLVGPELSIPGQWDVTVRARMGDFEELAATVAVPVNA